MNLEVSQLYKSTSKIVHKISSPILSLDINNTGICTKNLVSKFMSLFLDEKYAMNHDELVLILLNNASMVNEDVYLKSLRDNLKKLYNIYINNNFKFNSEREESEFLDKSQKLIDAIDLSGGFVGKITTTKDVFSRFESFLLNSHEDTSIIDYINYKGYSLNDENIFFSLLSISINEIADEIINKSLKSLSVFVCDIDDLIDNNNEVRNKINLRANFK